MKVPQQHRRPESVLVVVYTQAQQVLLLERCQPQGYWQSVTGSLEWGETPQACARRELLEETGFDLEPVDTGLVNSFKIMAEFHRQGRDSYAPGVEENTEYVFALQLANEIEPVISPAEHTRFAWQDAKTASNWCFSYTNAAAIERIVLSK